MDNTYMMALDTIAQEIAKGKRPAKACMEYGIPIEYMTDDELELVSIMVEGYYGKRGK